MLLRSTGIYKYFDITCFRKIEPNAKGCYRYKFVTYMFNFLLSCVISGIYYFIQEPRNASVRFVDRINYIKTAIICIQFILIIHISHMEFRYKRISMKRSCLFHFRFSVSVLISLTSKLANCYQKGYSTIS